MMIDLQLFGGRGSGSGNGPGLPSGGGGGIGGADVLDARGLSNEREKYASEIDNVLTVTRAFAQEWGSDAIPEDVQIAQISAGVPAMAYYDSNGNLAMNQAYFNNAKITKSYDQSVQNKFHPDRGEKSAMEAVAAHEMGHRLADVASQKATGKSSFTDGKTEERIVKNAAKAIKANGARGVADQISGYAKTSYSECIAEAVADVYCNGSKASRASRAVVSELKKVLGR